MAKATTSPAHTAGPWQYIKSQEDDVQNGSEHFSILTGESDDGWFIADLLNGLNQEAEANARLIAAAPDLLEALHLAVDMIEPAYPEADLDPDVKQIRAAIAKAEGNS